MYYMYIVHVHNSASYSTLPHGPGSGSTDRNLSTIGPSRRDRGTFIVSMVKHTCSRSAWVPQYSSDSMVLILPHATNILHCTAAPSPFPTSWRTNCDVPHAASTFCRLVSLGRPLERALQSNDKLWLHSLIQACGQSGMPTNANCFLSFSDLIGVWERE